MNNWALAAQNAAFGGGYGGQQQPFYNPRSYGQGFNQGFYNPGFGMVNQGIGTMNNLGGQIGGAFALANAQSGENMRNQVPVDVERLRQQGMMQRLTALSPLLAGIFGGMGQSVKPRNIQTNYGAGVNFS